MFGVLLIVESTSTVWAVVASQVPTKEEAELEALSFLQEIREIPETNNTEEINKIFFIIVKFCFVWRKIILGIEKNIFIFQQLMFCLCGCYHRNTAEKSY